MVAINTSTPISPASDITESGRITEQKFRTAAAQQNVETQKARTGSTEVPASPPAPASPPPLTEVPVFPPPVSPPPVSPPPRTEVPVSPPPVSPPPPPTTTETDHTADRDSPGILTREETEAWLKKYDKNGDGMDFVEYANLTSDIHQQHHVNNWAVFCVATGHRGSVKMTIEQLENQLNRNGITWGPGENLSYRGKDDPNAQNQSEVSSSDYAPSYDGMGSSASERSALDNLLTPSFSSNLGGFGGSTGLGNPFSQNDPFGLASLLGNTSNPWNFASLLGGASNAANSLASNPFSAMNGLGFNSNSSSNNIFSQMLERMMMEMMMEALFPQSKMNSTASNGTMKLLMQMLEKLEKIENKLWGMDKPQKRQCGCCWNSNSAWNNNNSANNAPSFQPQVLIAVAQNSAGQLSGIPAISFVPTGTSSYFNNFNSVNSWQPSVGLSPLV